MEVLAGILEPLGVPGEHAAAVGHLFIGIAGVAGGQVEAIDGEALLLDGVDKAQNSVVAVLLQLGIVHGGALIAQRPLGEQRGAAGQQGVIVHDLGQGAAAQQVQVNIAAVRLPIGVAGPVVALLAAHVEHGLIEVVIENAHSLLGVPVELDVEGDMLIQGIHLLGVVAHGVGGPLPEELLILVQQSGLLAEAIEAVLLVHPAVVHHPVVAVQHKGVARQILIEQSALRVIEPEGQGILLHLQPDGGSGKGQGLIVLSDLRHHRSHVLPLREEEIQPVLPGHSGQHIGLLGKLLVEGGPDPDDLVGDKADLHIRLVGVDEVHTVCRLIAGKYGTNFHNRNAPCLIDSVLPGLRRVRR